MDASSDGAVKLEVRDLSIYFDDLHVLDNISFRLSEGDFVSLLGPSGCGKSTLLNLVAGLLAPTSGTITRDGIEVTAPGPDRSMVFQDDAVFPWYTVVQNVEYGLRVKGVEKRERREKAQGFVDLVGLSGREDAYPYQLSGGMRKRVDVARALAAEPDVLLMDEPFASLDAMTKTRLQAEFLRIWENSRATVLFVTHDVEEALYLSERVFVMSTEPGRLFHLTDVPFPHPREESLRTSTEFQDHRAELIAALHRAGAQF
ncbi:MAG: ABC transporter ATP-binding protein [Acidimicrobiia bacterium]|nr:ABC transporter ATP-binding protein [Acidimicrobiia bacterium]